MRLTSWHTRNLSFSLLHKRILPNSNYHSFEIWIVSRCITWMRKKKIIFVVVSHFHRAELTQRYQWGGDFWSEKCDKVKSLCVYFFLLLLDLLRNERREKLSWKFNKTTFLSSSSWPFFVFMNLLFHANTAHGEKNEYIFFWGIYMAKNEKFEKEKKSSKKRI